MKRLLIIILGIVCFHVVGMAQEVRVEVRGIRNAKGYIMVMAQPDSKTKPVYAMVKATKDTTTVILKEIPWKEYQLSLFHDENENSDLDRNAQGMPIEGYVREKFKKEQDASVTVKVKVYYPVVD